MSDKLSDLSNWNKRLYSNNDSGCGAQWFWDNFKIKSAPLYRDSCYSHIPSLWADDVAIMIRNIQGLSKNSVQFTQIKEKFCDLVVYRDCPKEYEKAVSQEVQDCRNRLKEKNLIWDHY